MAKISVDGKEVSALESHAIKHGVSLVVMAVKRQLDKATNTPAVESAIREEYKVVQALQERLS